MPVRDDRDGYDREILDIIPERFDADPDSHYARKGAHTRLILTVALGLLAVAALGVAARHIFFDDTPKPQTAGVPVIKPDDRPIKTKPDDRGGMDVPNQDKLVYERMGSQSDAVPQTERLLPPPEQPQDPPAQQPRKPTIKPAFPPPPTAAGNTAAPAAPSAATASAPLPPPAVSAAPAAPAANNALSPAKPTSASAKAPAGTKTAAVKLPAAPSASPASPASAAAPAAPASAPAASAKAATAGGSWLVQLGALKTETEAKTEWNRVKSANKDVLGDYGSDVVRADLGEKGTFWRLRAGPMDEGQARSICAMLAKRNQGCIIAKK